MLRDEKGRFVARTLGDCLECEEPMVGYERWRAMSEEERSQGAVRCHGGRGICKRCLKREYRSRTLRGNAWGAVYEESEFMFSIGISEMEVAQRLGIQIESLRRSRKRWLERAA